MTPNFSYLGLERKKEFIMSMRDISEKKTTIRTAVARAVLRASRSSIDAIRQNKVPKGDPLPIAKVAAISAAKNTGHTIPYCHPLPIDFADCTFSVGADSIEITAEVKATYKTGVEMEALSAVSVAALTIYDMLKMIDTDIVIENIHLVKKTGGKSDYHKTGK